MAKTHEDDCGHAEHLPHPFTNDRLGSVTPSGHEGNTWERCTALQPPQDAQAARVARYAEAIRTEWERRNGIVAAPEDHCTALAVAAMAVADGEQEQLRAEVERVRADYSRAAKYRDEYRDEAHEGSQALLDMIGRVEAAEAALAAMRARVGALADEWQRMGEAAIDEANRELLPAAASSLRSRLLEER